MRGKPARRLRQDGHGTGASEGRSDSNGCSAAETVRVAQSRSVARESTSPMVITGRTYQPLAVGRCEEVRDGRS